MPKQRKYSRQEIIEGAVELIREKGFKALSTRGVGEKLWSSSKVVFTEFKNMGELRCEVIKRAKEIFNEFVLAEISRKQYPPYKATGMAYIFFAKKEKELFRLLYMRDRTGEQPEAFGYEVDILGETLGISRKMAEKMHLEMWIFVHGIATMIADNYIDWKVSDISNMITDIFEGLKVRSKEWEK